MNLQNATPGLFAAIALAQAEVENAAKSSQNPHFKSRYADLAEVLNTVRPVYAKHGIGIIQSTHLASDRDNVVVTTALVYKDGGYITSEASCVPAKFDPQGIGSATTYLRRYALAAMSGIAQEDDDGNSSQHNRQPQRAEPDQTAELSYILTLIREADCDEQFIPIREAIGRLQGQARKTAIDAGLKRQAELKSTSMEKTK